MLFQYLYNYKILYILLDHMPLDLFVYTATIHHTNP